MFLKSNRGYSLVEIGVGILILTAFLLVSIALFNGCYNTYRRINQRNIAMDDAIKNMEALLQGDSGVWTGFFDYNIVNRKPEPTAEFFNYINENRPAYKERYARITGNSEDEFIDLSTAELKEYINRDRNYFINSYIEKMIEQDTYSEEELQEGRYGFLSGDTFELGNMILLHPEKSSDIAYQSYLVPTNNNAVGIRRTIRRLPATNGKAYGNNILKVKVEVFYTRKIEYKNLTPDDIESITIESIKISN